MHQSIILHRHIFLKLGVLNENFSWNCFNNNNIIFFCQSLQVIHIPCKSILGLWWMKMAMVNSGLKGLNAQIGLLITHPYEIIISYYYWRCIVNGQVVQK